MKSGLEGRNNLQDVGSSGHEDQHRLNEVRPRRPEQYIEYTEKFPRMVEVSMKSGLEGRNNVPGMRLGRRGPAMVVSMKSGLEGRNNPHLPS